jgi:hypothetical protein
METFRGKAPLPGTEKEYEIELEIDWNTREISVHIDGVAKGISDWPGLAVQTFGPFDEVVFRTKGIPGLFTHWWHFVRGINGELAGIVIGLPDVEGIWRTCPLKLEKVE